MKPSKLRQIKIRVHNDIEFKAVLRALFDDNAYWAHDASRVIPVYENEVGFYVNQQGGVFVFKTEAGFASEPVKECFFSLQVKAHIQDPVRKSVRIGAQLYDFDQVKELIDNAKLERVDY